jgi:hypothetical protein
VSASATGKALTAVEQPASALIRKISTTVDPATGAWTTAVTFKATQSAGTARPFNVAIKPVDMKGPIASWTGSTNPDAPAVAYNPISERFPAGGAPAIEASFNAERKVLTMRTTDPHIVGHEPDYVSAVVTTPDGNTQLSQARAFLGPVAPSVVIAKGARHLTVGARRLVTVPLVRLSGRVERRVEVRTAQGRLIGVHGVSGKNAASASVRVRISASAFRRLGPRYRTARLRITNRLENGSTATKVATVRLRRG